MNQSVEDNSSLDIERTMQIADSQTGWRFMSLPVYLVEDVTYMIKVCPAF